MFLECFKEAYGGLKCINILPKKVCFVSVVGMSSQVPEQKEGLFFLNPSQWISIFTIVPLEFFYPIFFCFYKILLKNKIGRALPPGWIKVTFSNL